MRPSNTTGGSSLRCRHGSGSVDAWPDPAEVGRRGARVVGVVILLSILTVGCSASSGTVGGETTIAATSPSDASVESPPDTTGPTGDLSFKGALQDAFGYSLADIEWAAERELSDRLADCMIAEGWEFERVIPPRFDASADNRTTSAEQALDDVDEWNRQSESEETPSPGFDQGEYNRAQAQCFETSAADVPNPASSAWSWLATQTEDIQAEVASDPRTIDAQSQEGRCLSETGYDRTTLQQANEAFDEQSWAIAAEFRGGSITHDDAVRALEELSAQQRELWELTDPCIDERLRIVGLVAAEKEAAWLADNGDVFAVAVAGFVEEIDHLKRQLDAIAGES